MFWKKAKITYGPMEKVKLVEIVTHFHRCNVLEFSDGMRCVITGLYGQVGDCFMVMKCYKNNVLNRIVTTW